MNELDAEIKLVLEQPKTRAVQNRASATPRPEQEKILSTRRMMEDLLALGVPFEPISKVTNLGYLACRGDSRSLIRPVSEAPSPITRPAGDLEVPTNSFEP
jgi:hypothetical protein